MDMLIDWKLDFGDRGVLAPGRWLWARGILWALALFVMAAISFIAALQLSNYLKLPNGFDYLCAIVLPIVAILIYRAGVRAVEKRSVTEFALQKAPLELIIGALIGFTFMAASLSLLWALGLYQVHLGHWKHWYNFFLFNAYVSGLLEELAFRAILLRILGRLVGPMGGLVLSAALFGLAHAAHAPLWAVAQIVLNGGLTMGLLYMASGRLWLSIGMHVGYDFTEWSIVGVGDRSGLLTISPTPGHSVWLTGGDFGPDGSILAGLFGGLIIAGILVVSKQRSEAKALPTRP